MLADIGGGPCKSCVEETELLAFDYFWMALHYLEEIVSILPAVKKKAREMQAERERLTGHPRLPREVTANLAADE